MKPAFDINGADVVEFGVGLDEGENQRFTLVPAGAEVQAVLKQMAIATRDEMHVVRDDAVAYEPSEKYDSPEHLLVPTDDAMASRFKQLHTANNMDTDANALDDPSKIFCYFARFKFRKGKQRLTAVRRATSFKGILKSPLIRFLDNALRIVEEQTFKLDHDFDVLLDDDSVYILRPAGFEFVGQLDAEIAKAVPGNVQSVKADLPFVDFTAIQTYAIDHPRAARYLASIRSQKLAENVDKGALKKLCKSTNVIVREVGGKLVIDPKSILDFLGVLDRRLYEVELIKGSPEPFRAARRSRIT
jgi:hypothetical protein